MCGILFSARVDEDAEYTQAWEILKAANTRRGLDAQDSYNVALECPVCEPVGQSCRMLYLDFFSSELRLRGSAHIVQPYRRVREGDVLCWNGEVFDGLDVAAHENDGVKLFEKLSLANTVDEIRDTFASIEGPYAFVYYQGVHRRLFYARDPLGRRSLLRNEPTGQFPLILSSVSDAGQGYDFEEVSTRNIFCIDLTGTCFGKVNFSALATSLPRLPLDPHQASLTPYGEPQTVNRTLPPADLPRLEPLIDIPDHLAQTVDKFIDCLSASVKQRVANVPIRRSITDAQVAVLFSGGIDCTIIAYLAHLYLPIEEPIDLLNVGFENPRKQKAKVVETVRALPRKEARAKGREHSDGASMTSAYKVPDRVTGLEELEELRRLAPNRTWNFVEVNVPYEETQAERPIIASLMLPGKTVMDLSLAMALYFASRGVGQLAAPEGEEPVPYASNARVLLSGLGSDELLGGYGRHRTVFYHGGWEAVIEELQLEIDRIPTRNLGRDDRVISSHGKETRHPFLSLSVVKFLAELPVHHKVDPRLEVGLGDKLLLRLAARKLGLVEASTRKKRAMQFGSHSARMEAGAIKGDMLVE